MAYSVEVGTVAHTIKTIRKWRRETQAMLAKNVGTSQGTISMIESGDRMPSIPMLRRIGKALGTTAGHILHGDLGHYSARARADTAQGE